MIKNFFKIAWRNLVRNKGFSFINISGLVIGMASAVLILLWIQNEISYDRFHTNADRLYEVYSNDVINNSIRSLTNTPEIMAPGLKNDVPEIEQASRVSGMQYHVLNVGDKSLQPKGEMVDAPFLSMFSFPLEIGNVKTALTDAHSIVLTEQPFEQLMGKGSAVSKTFHWDGDTTGSVFNVIGVVNDFVCGDMYGKPDPVMFYCAQDGNMAELFVRLKPTADVETAMKTIEAVIKKDNPSYPFTYQFTDDQFNKMFLNETLIRKLSRVFAALAIIISCLGLFGLAAFTAERRTKEIGIRKVLGASVSGIATLLSKDFLQLVVISCIVSFPVAWLIMHSWLQNYKYRIDISWWIFLAAGISAILIALITICFQSIKAAIANPVKSLRTE